MNNDEQEIKRSIDEVIDVETGEIIKSIDFFKKSEAEIFEYRERLQKVINGYAEPKFKCAYCNQLLKLSGRETQRGQISYFAHLYDSDDCEVKTNKNLSKEEIEAIKFGNVGESERHKKLKEQLVKYLNITPKFSNVESEKSIISENPYLYWRRPDVYAEFNGMKIVFELQLSTTFLSVIIDRDVFYRANNIYIIWIFNFSENTEYVNLNNVMSKDIYYANKRNAFVFDDKAQSLSDTTGELHFLCIWFEPKLENGIYNRNNITRYEKYIKISDLKFDNITFKPYYIDTDVLFGKYDETYIEVGIDLENAHKMRLERLAKKQRVRERLKVLEKQKINEIKNNIEKGEMQLHPFNKSGKWGYLAENTIVVEPKYSEASVFSECGYARVKFNRRYGFINKLGERVTDIIYNETFDIYNKKCIVKLGDEFLILNLENNDSKKINCSAILDFKNTKTLLEIIPERISQSKSRLWKNKINKISVVSMDGESISKFIRYKVLGSEVGNFRNAISEFYVLIDIYGRETKVNEYIQDFDGKYEMLTGIVDTKGNILIQPVFETIDDFIDGGAIAKKDDLWGMIDEKGGIVIPFNYKRISIYEGGRLLANRNEEFALFDRKGNGIYVFKIQNSFKGKYGETITDSKYGIKNMNDDILLEPKYHKIELLKNGLCKIYRKIGIIKTNNRDKIIKYKVGCVDFNGNLVIQCIYDEIYDFIDGKAKVKINGRYFYIDKHGNQVGRVSLEIDKFKIGSIYHGKVASKEPYGLMIESDSGFTSLLHVSELEKHKKSISSYRIGDRINVAILSIDEVKKRIALTLI